MGEGSAMQEQLPMDAAVERTGMYSQRVRKAYVDQLLYSLVQSIRIGGNLSSDESRKTNLSPPFQSPFSEISATMRPQTLALFDLHLFSKR